MNVMMPGLYWFACSSMQGPSVSMYVLDLFGSLKAIRMVLVFISLKTYYRNYWIHDCIHHYSMIMIFSAWLCICFYTSFASLFSPLLFSAQLLRSNQFGWMHIWMHAYLDTCLYSSLTNFKFIERLDLMEAINYSSL